MVVCVHDQSLSPVQLFCDPMDCSPPGSSSRKFSRQEYQSGLSFPPPGDLPEPGIQPESPALNPLESRLCGRHCAQCLRASCHSIFIISILTQNSYSHYFTNEETDVGKDYMTFLRLDNESADS